MTLRFFSHTLTRLPDGGTRISHRLEITGPKADELGPESSARRSPPTSLRPWTRCSPTPPHDKQHHDKRRPRDRGAEYSPGFWLWHATLRWQREIAAVLAPLGLTHVQFVLLSCAWWLNDHGLVPNQLELARQAGTDVKMTSQVVRKLETKGLLQRETDPDDTERVGCASLPTGQSSPKQRSSTWNAGTRRSSGRP